MVHRKCGGSAVSSLASDGRVTGFDPPGRRGKDLCPNMLPFMPFA